MFSKSIIKKNINKYLPTILITVLVLTAVLWPGSMLPEQPSKIPGFDKIVHVCLFFAWTVAVVHDFNLKWHQTLGVVVMFALATELVQLGVEGRSFDPMDLLADTAGAIFGLVLSGFVIRIIKKVLRR